MEHLIQCSTFGKQQYTTHIFNFTDSKIHICINERTWFAFYTDTNSLIHYIKRIKELEHYLSKDQILYIQKEMNMKPLYYIYESHLTGEWTIYNEKKTVDELYCSVCGDSDIYIAMFDSLIQAEQYCEKYKDKGKYNVSFR